MRCPECNYDHEIETPAASCLRWRTDDDLQNECLRRGLRVVDAADKAVLDACEKAVFLKDERGQFWLSQKEGAGYSELEIVDAEVARRFAKGSMSGLSGWEFSVYAPRFRQFACPECVGIGTHKPECSRHAEPLPRPLPG